MRVRALSIVILLMAVTVSPAYAADPGPNDPSGHAGWTSLFVGGDIGASITSSGFTNEGTTYSFPTSAEFTTGFEAGFLIETPIRLVVGLDTYGNFNFAANNSLSGSEGRRGTFSLNKTYGTNAYGGDLRIGYDLGRVLPYALIGGGIIEGTQDLANLDGAGVHAGLGVDVLVARYVGLFGEWSIQQASANAGAFGFPNGTANFLINDIVGGVSMFFWLPGMQGPID